MEINKKFSLQALAENRKALIAVSFVIALFVWITISLNEAPEVERVVEHVPVTIDDSVPKQLGYEAFGADEVYVDITVKGKRYLVGDNVLSADDFEVTAITTYVDSPGSYALQLKATAKDANASYSIVSKSQDYVEVYFDAPKTAELAVEPNVKCESESIVYSDEYITDTPISSVEKVRVSGPATEVDKIKKAVATISTKGNLRTAETLDAELSIVDAYGSELKYITIETAVENLTVTVPVYKLTELPVTVGFYDTPLYYIENPLTVVCTPSKIKVAVDENKLESMKNVTLGDVSFRALKPGINTLELKASDLTDAIPVDKEQKITVYINTGDVVTMPYTIPAKYINVTKDADGLKTRVVSEKLDVTLVGPKSVLEALKPGDVYAELDFSEFSPALGNSTAPATVKIKDSRCWAYGRNNTVEVISEKA